MLKKIAILFWIFFIPVCYSEKCPTVAQIKHGLFNEWQPLNLDSAEPLSDDELIDFQHSLRTFAFAGWLEDAPEGSAECFYYGNPPEQDYLGVFLVKSLNAPDLSSGYWKKEMTGFFKCNKSIDECPFPM